MEIRKFVVSQSLPVLAGQLVAAAMMVPVSALLGHYDRSVLLGAAAGTLLACLNHTLLVLGVAAASGKAENQNLKGGQAVLQLSRTGRLLGLFLILVLCARSARFSLPALVIPLLLTRPILAAASYFSRKKGGAGL